MPRCVTPATSLPGSGARGRPPREGAPVVLFCAKLQPWKRPQDALRALARAGLQGTHLVYAGEGPLRAKLQAEAESLGLARRVHFTGFANQSELPAIYRAANLLVLPSEYEPFGVVVNEAMLCGCAVAVSNRVGAGFDLVQPGQNGFVYPVGDVDALAGIFCEVLPDGERLRQMGEAARKRMETWTSREYVEALLTAVERAVRLKSEESNLAINFQTEAHARSEEHTSELQSPCNLVCRLLLEKKKKIVRRRLQTHIESTH